MGEGANIPVNPNSGETRNGRILAALLAYTAVVHAVDTLAAAGARFPIDWSAFRCQHDSGFDVFKFLAWLVVPFLFLLALRRIEPGYFGFRRWKPRDGILLAALAVLGMIAVLSILVFPSLQRFYEGMADAPAAARWSFLRYQLAWTFSWLVGWEFLHRYALLTLLDRVWPRFGWLAVPVIEGLYHLQKAPLEMLGMVVFSLLLTHWARRRRNVLLPFLAHLAVELELIAFLLLVP